MSSSHLDVRYTAQLARLDLTDDEIATFQSQLSQVLEYVDQLKKVNVDDVDPSPYSDAEFNVVRPDEVRPSLTHEQAIANAPQKANNLVMVTKVIE